MIFFFKSKYTYNNFAIMKEAQSMVYHTWKISTNDAFFLPLDSGQIRLYGVLFAKSRLTQSQIWL